MARQSSGTRKRRPRSRALLGMQLNLRHTPSFNGIPGIRWCLARVVLYITIQHTSVRCPPQHLFLYPMSRTTKPFQVSPWEGILRQLRSVEAESRQSTELKHGAQCWSHFRFGLVARCSAFLGPPRRAGPCFGVAALLKSFRVSALGLA